MKSDQQLKDSPTGDSGPDTFDHQPLLIDILNFSLEPLYFKAKLDKILDAILGAPHLHFGTKAALFMIDQITKTLDLKILKDFPDSGIKGCNGSRLDVCHCGETVLRGKIRFFSTPPPLFNIRAKRQQFHGNYCIPLIKDDQPLGVLTIYVTKKHKQSAEITSLLEAIANILATVIESQQMDQQMVQLVKDLRYSVINLREEKRFSESVIQGLNHGLIVVDNSGQVRKSNSAAKSILKPFGDAVDGENLIEKIGEKAAKQLMLTNKSKTPQPERELSLTTPAGENILISFSNVSREDAHGEQVGVIISLSDISEIKYVRKEMEKMNRLSTVAEIASAVAHEVRNPLAGIKIMAQSIEEEATEESEQQECSQRIIRQVDRLNELLSDFFSYARPAEPNIRATSLNDIVNETKPLIKSKLGKLNIDLNDKISTTLPHIFADPHQVQQVLLNLFLNAIDAMQGKGKIDISAKVLTKKQLKNLQKKYPAVLEDDHLIMVNFADNGAGMSPKTAEQVFEPFFTTKSSGAGLGLSIVYRTLKENDAAIVLESEVGKGTTFIIFFKSSE